MEIPTQVWRQAILSSFQGGGGETSTPRAIVWHQLGVLQSVSSVCLPDRQIKHFKAQAD